MTVIIRIIGPYQEVVDAAAALSGSKILCGQSFIGEHWNEGSYCYSVCGTYDRKHALAVLEAEAEP